MRIWTTQSEKVIKFLLDNKKYDPDFRLSNGLGSKEMKGAYQGILTEYQKRNNINCNGLIFGISKLDDKPVENISQYIEYFKRNDTFWDSVSYAGSDYAMLELEVPDDIDLLPIYFQDFIILAYRAIRSDEFKEYVKPHLVNKDYSSFDNDFRLAQNEGWTNDEVDLWGEVLLNRITQVHIHQIKIEDIVGVYETFDYNTLQQSDLGDNAKQLKKVIKSFTEK